MLSFALAPLLMSQAVTPAALEDAPVPAPTLAAPTAPVPAVTTIKTRFFVIEYPISISPAVAKYTGCLRSRDVILGPGRTFESEHRRAVPLCAAIEVETKQAAFERLAKTPKYAMTMEQLGELYEGIRMTHINRGRVMDGFMDRGLDRDPYANQVGVSKESYIELDSASQ